MLVQVGVDQTSAPLAWRERLAIEARGAGRFAASIVRCTEAVEAFVLATCSRVEVYAVALDPARLERELLDRFARRAGCPLEELGGVVRVRHGADAARHLLRTAAGLESAVLGEHEILGQLRRAHHSAVAEAATGPALDQLVTHGVRAGRRVRAETGLAAGAASLTSLVPVLARNLVGDVAGRRAVVAGDTRTARRAADCLVGDGWSVTVAPGGGVEPLLPAFDVVVSCSGGVVAVGAEALRRATRDREGAPLLVVDISVPRDVDPAARGVAGVVLYDVDDLAAAARRAVAERRTHVAGAEAWVAEELQRFEDWRTTRSLVPTLKALRDHHRRAVADVLGELPDEVVERLVTRLVHAPTARLRAAAASGTGEAWAATMRELFGFGEPATRGDRDGRSQQTANGSPARA
jgi:glutamyl-tRNA reductase